MTDLKLSNLRKTWLIDIDGVLFPHNFFLDRRKRSKDNPLPGVKSLFKQIPSSDYIILLTGREERYRPYTSGLLKRFGIRYDLLIMGLPNGERILINDIKPYGLKTAHAINVKRNGSLGHIRIKEKAVVK